MLLKIKVRGSNPGGGEVFRTRPYRPWGPPSLLYGGYRVCFLEVKRLGPGVNHLLPSSAEVKGRVDLYLCSPSGSSWPVLRRPLSFILPSTRKWNSRLTSCCKKKEQANRRTLEWSCNASVTPAMRSSHSPSRCRGLSEYWCVLWAVIYDEGPRQLSNVSSWVMEGGGELDGCSVAVFVSQWNLFHGWRVLINTSLCYPSEWTVDKRVRKTAHCDY